MPLGLAYAIIASTAASRAPKRELLSDEVIDETLAKMAREIRELKEEMRRRDDRNRIRKILGL